MEGGEILTKLQGLHKREGEEGKEKEEGEKEEEEEEEEEGKYHVTPRDRLFTDHENKRPAVERDGGPFLSFSLSLSPFSVSLVSFSL